MTIESKKVNIEYMGKIRTFLFVFRQSLTSPSYYQDVIKAPFSFSIKFFYFYFFLYALVGTGYIWIKFKPIIPILTHLPSKLEQIYPDELEIKIINGQVSTNVKEPYFISFPDVEKLFSPNDKVLGSQKDIKNLLVIDTNAGIDDFNKYQTAVLLTRNHVILADSEQKGKLNVYPLNDVENIVINKKLVTNSINQFSPFINIIIPTLLIVVFFSLFLFLPTSHLFYLLWFSLLLLLLSKVMSAPLSYRNSYHIGMHAIILPTTLFGLLSLVDINLSFPFLRTTIMLIFSGIILKHLKKTMVSPTNTIPSSNR